MGVRAAPPDRSPSGFSRTGAAPVVVPVIGYGRRMRGTTGDATVEDVSLYEGLLTTRAIRRYTDEPVPDEALRDILFAATRAPSGSNRQPFRFVVLTGGPVAQEAKRLVGEGARRFWDAK